jgi:putative ABC transport system permease protein
MTNLLTDFQLAMRRLIQSPGISFVILLTLILGIGATTTVFSLVDAVILKPLPYSHPEQLVEVEMVGRHGYEPSNISYPDFFDLRSQNHSLSHLVSYHDKSVTLTGFDQAIHLDGEVVSWDLLPLLGVQPELGRGFMPEEEREGARVALISHALWISRYAGDRSVLGQNISLSDSRFTIIGVMPASFRFPLAEPQNAFWTTSAVDKDPANSQSPVDSRNLHYLGAIGRLNPGSSLAWADQDLKAIAANLAKQYPMTNSGQTSAMVQSELANVLGDTRTLFFIVFGAVVLLLLIACGNVANLMMVRVREREREIAIRSALGAGRRRIVQESLVESVTLGLAGGIAGCALTFFCTPVVLRLIGDGVPRAEEAGVNLPVLAFAALTSLASVIFFGVVPALRASAVDPITALKDGGGAAKYRRDWLRSGVVVGQVALSILLTAGAGLLATSFLKLLHAPEGFNPDHLLVYLFNLPDQQYRDRIPQFYQEYFRQLRALPGVESAGGARVVPMTSGNLFIKFDDPLHPSDSVHRLRAEMTPVSSGFFKAMQAPVIEGRDFNEADDVRSRPVMIVNHAFAQEFLPGEDPVGKRVRPYAANGSEAPPLREIVGVVGDMRQSATQGDMPPAMYLPANQLPSWCCFYSVVRTSVDPLSLEPAVRHLVNTLDKNIPVTDVQTMHDLLGMQLNQPRFAIGLMGSFAVLAMVLTVVGLYGVMLYSVSRRTREIGIRLALGAQRRTVLLMVIRESGTLLLTGATIGLLAAVASTSVLQSMLYKTATRDPIVLAGVCTVNVLIGILAAYIPARRAASVQPMQALRTD